MSWLVWRQHRWDAASALAVLLVLGGGMIILAAASANLLADISRVCASPSSGCDTLRTNYGTSFGAFQTFITTAGIVIPVLIGVFAGAPMVAREFELGTNLLVWAQGITLRRWFAFKVLLIAAGVVICTGVLGAIFQLWLAPQRSVADLWYSFDVEPVVLVAYSIFALALGIAFGTIIQRTIPAMAATLVTFVAIRVAVEQFIRPMYLPPLSWDVGTNMPTDAALLFVGTQAHIDSARHAITDAHWNEVFQQCSSSVQTANSPGALHDCLLSHGVLVVQQYQPESRFWLFQSIEGAIFTALALVLIAIAYRFILRNS
jgi:hypothetical protein